MTLFRFYTLINIQARMALRADASRFYLGYLWWIVEPLLFVGVFYLVFDVILDSRRADFLIFLVTGKLPFIWFSSTVNSAATSIVSSKGIIGQLSVSKAIFPMSKVQEGLYRQFAVFALLIFFVLLSGAQVSSVWFYLVPLVIVQYFLIATCSIIGAILVVFARDFVKIIGLSMTFLLFVSGIFWDVRKLSNESLSELLLIVNPITFLLDGYRQVLLYGGHPDVVHLFSLCVLFSLGFYCSLLICNRIEQNLAIRVLSE